MNSLRARVLLLVAGFGLLTAVALALVMHQSVRSYYNNVLYHRACEFLDRVVQTNPRLWEQYESDPQGFSERLHGYTLYSPNIGLYLLDEQGRVLASAGNRQSHWTGYQVDLAQIQRELHANPLAPTWGDDPDAPGSRMIVAARRVDEARIGASGWLYLVARSADLGTQMPELLRSYAIRTAVKVGLLVLAIGVLLTMTVVAILTRPLLGLTRVAEQLKSKGFDRSEADPPFPHLDRNDEIGRLARTFREMVERLRIEMQRVTQTDARRREMVASVSHDVRTPLTALIGHLETIRIKGGGLTAEEHQRYLDRALQNAQHLKRLTDALAELARLDSPDFVTQKEPIALGELADDIAQRFALRAQEAGVVISVTYPQRLPTVHLDAQLIERALANLLDNALRVTPRGGHIEVGVTAHQAEIRLAVSDTGPGVSEQDRQRVFDRFYQSTAHRDLRGSAGLGLAIVRRVAELHGGRTGVDSLQGQGATFWMTLPAMQTITEEVPAVSGPPALHLAAPPGVSSTLTSSP
jgi:signal transduction histidine kinase